MDQKPNIDGKFGNSQLEPQVAKISKIINFGMDLSTVSDGITIPAWNRRQSRTESPLWPGIADGLARNRQGSAAVAEPLNK